MIHHEAPPLICRQCKTWKMKPEHATKFPSIRVQPVDNPGAIVTIAKAVKSGPHHAATLQIRADSNRA
jgi:hypothetical protein